ncbi:hypothetical protein CPC08DRAFT_714846 [Agrocybe pediades]|nr:hypothetical protein CPC08DRAFT_714846 [Agrocybe pediades]
MGTPRKDSTSSVDSTPVHTPVVSPTTLGLSLGHPSNDLKSAAGEAGGATHEMIDDDITPRVDGVGRPSWGSSTPTSATEIAVPKSTRMAVPMSTAGEEGAYGSGAMGVGGSMGMGMSPSDVVLGSSPPFSFSSMLGSRPTIEKANEGGYWPWSSFSGSSSTTAAPDKGNSLSNGGVGGEAKKAKASEATTTTNPNANATSKGPAAQTHTRIPSSSDVAAAFGSPSPRTGMVGLPHRRARKDSGGGALKLAPPPAVAPRARANGNDDRDSDSSSASVSSAGAGGQYPQVQGQSSEQRQASVPTPAPAQKSMNMGAGPALWGLRPASPLPGSPRPGSPRPPASSGTRSPLRVSPVNSSSNLVGMGNGGVKSPLGMAMNMGMEMNSPGTPVYDVGPSVPVPVLGSSSAQAQAQETKSGSSTTSDAIYQAFCGYYRCWCFLCERERCSRKGRSGCG